MRRRLIDQPAESENMRRRLIDQLLVVDDDYRGLIDLPIMAISKV